ncbi:hypothetical protein BDW62DRAFT_151257 [Aspergillus aurantiobrunneus]
MPHTRRKKNPSTSNQHKRLQVSDSSGWTHVTTTKSARRIHRNPNPNPDQGDDELLEPLVPAEAPAKTTLSDLQRQLGLYKGRWEESAAWGSVVEGLRRGLPLLSGREGESKDEDQDDVSIVCIGLGSPSGFLRGGWVDRRAISMYQLAALVSAMGWIEKHIPSTEPGVKVYAQDPVFNTHDVSLLDSLNITVLTHPSAFEKVTSRTLLFCPGAERRHLEILLARDPAIVFGGPLEDIDSDAVRGFVAQREYMVLASFDEMETAFWGMSVYYPHLSEDG